MMGSQLVTGVEKEMMLQSATVSFDVQVTLKDRGDHWAAYIEPPGMTVYGPTEDAVDARVDDAIEFFKRHFRDDPDGVTKLRQYLDAHGVPNVVTGGNEARPMRLRRPVSLLMGVA